MSELRLYEELLLLSLQDRKGKVTGTYVDLALAAGVLGELVEEGRISVADTKKATVTVLDDSPTGDPVVDAVVEKLASARRQAPLRSSIQRIARTRGLRKLVANRLVERGILAEQDGKVLGILRSTRYPDASPGAEHEVTARVRDAVLGDGDVDERTCLLIAIADAAELLPRIFDRSELKARKDRIAALATDERLAEATRRAVQAIQAAMVTAIVAGSSSN